MSRRVYFAYGSNMSRPRLEARVGAVTLLGPGRLADHVHSFSKLGADGSGKGNIAAKAKGFVHGILYELDAAQMEILDAFEGGYARASVEIEESGGTLIAATTYIAPPAAGPPAPRADYLIHYQNGMLEHELPPEYIREILRQAGRLDGDD